MLSFWNFLINSTCDFLSSLDFLSCSLRSSLWFLMQLFSSCLSRSFPSIYSVECSAFWLFFNFLIFATCVLLWFFNLKISSKLLDNVLLPFAISNLCAFLESSFCCWRTFIRCWYWLTFDSWSFNFFRICVSSSFCR